MAEFPAMPLWTDSYLADCGHLDDAETGRYLLILIHMWRAPDQRLPNDDAWLAHKFRRSVEDVRAQLRPIFDEFCQCNGNWITQKRLAREHAYVRGASEKQRARANSRWAKEKDLCRGNATRCNAPTPTPTPIKKKERVDKSTLKKNPKDALIPILGTEMAGAVVEHRQRLGKPLTFRAAEMLATQFAKHHDPPAGAEMMLARGWQGFKAEWMEDRNHRRSNADDRSDRKTEMARRQDERSKADSRMDDEASGGDALALFPARPVR